MIALVATIATAVAGPVPQGVAHTDFQPAFPGQTRAQERHSGVVLVVEEVARGLEHPWSLAWMPDGRLLVTERPGRLRVVTPEGEISAPIAGLPAVDARGQGGLLDVVLSPRFGEDRLVYWSYAEARDERRNGTSVARGRLSPDVTRLDEVAVIFRQQPAWRSTGHFGSRLVFDHGGHLYVTLGDRQGDDSRASAQDLQTHIGKIVRIGADGGAAPDNPFANRSGARAEIWSWGHRNVQGADLHPQSGELWAVEHGPRGGDELNLVRAGRNYGWPVISYGEEYSGFAVGRGIAVRTGMEQPLYYWDPVIAPGDMDFYRGELFPWRGNILIAALGSRALVRLELDGERVIGEEHFDVGARLRDIEEDQDGVLWALTDDANGRLLRLTPRR